MVQPSQVENQAQAKILESQIRECYGRVVYSHKTHEKMADICLKNLKIIKISEIILSALTTTALIYALFGDGKASTIIAAVFSTLLLALTLYTKEYNLGEVAQKHTNTANNLWLIREELLSLIVDIKSNTPINIIKEKRDKFNLSLSNIYSGSPRTNGKAYKMAQDALKKYEELTFTDKEIDLLLPHDLRQNIN